MRRISSLIPRLLGAILVGCLLLACAGAASVPAPGRPIAGQPLDDVGNSIGDGSGDEVADDGDQAPAPQDGALIVYTGSMELEVADLRGALDAGANLVAGLGGHVTASHEEGRDEYRSATVTYRIPAERWGEALAGLRGLGQKVLGEDTDSEDVTAQVIDLDARIANLQASEAALQAIMARATTITDVLKVQQELTGVRSDIESMIAQRDNLAERAALATLKVAFNVPVAAAAVATGGWDLGREVDSAVATLVRVGQGAASLVIWLVIVLLPVAIPVLLALFLAVRVRRWYVARQTAQVPSTPSL
jgi:hypothetical protein